MKVQPTQLRVGEMVTITGRTRGYVQFLPPLVIMASTRTVPAHYPGPCRQQVIQPAAEATVVQSGDRGGRGSRKNPRAGTIWRVTFRTPRVMSRAGENLSTVKVTPPPGQYYLAAIAVGIDLCSVPTKSGFGITVATVTLGR
jgi:hypothetical protein